MEKRVKELTKEELEDICKKHRTDCHDCPLAVINGCELICIKKDILNRKVKVK